MDSHSHGIFLGASWPMSILAVVNGREVVRDEVLAWEARRIEAAARKLGLTVSTNRLSERRAALLQAKLDLGPQHVEARLERDVRWAARIGRASNHPKHRRRVSVCELRVSSGSAARFATWFQDRTRANDQEAMLAACPDHFVIRTLPDGRQEVLETTGGSPLASRFFVDYDDASTLITQPDSAFPVQIAGTAFMTDGLPVGGVRHQFRDNGDGFHARLTVEFPALTNPHMLAQHRWHLACEFSNWIEAAASSDRPPLS
jgi:hypothetical protein